MWMSPFMLYDPKRWRAEVAYYTDLRETFDDPLPIHSYAPYHPLMIHNRIAANRAKQAAVLNAILRHQKTEHERGKQIMQEYEAAQPPKPNVPGTPGFDPNLPSTTPPAPQPGQPGYRPPGEPTPGSVPHEPQHDPTAPPAEPRTAPAVYPE